MSKTKRNFKGKEYRQGHEPCELDLTRKRAEKRERLMRTQDHRLEMIDQEIDAIGIQALREAVYEEQVAMGYDRYAD